MKKIIYLLLINSIMICCVSQKYTTDKEKEYKIKKAYDYLMDKKIIKNDIVVADTIQKIETEPLAYLMHSYSKSNLNLSKYQDSLDSEDWKSKHKEYYYPIRKLLNNKNEYGNEIIYFSKPRGNFITAEVFDYREKKKSYNFYYFGPTMLYLFEFKDGEIVKMYKERINYN